jgi:RND family efflux transporter MFP subunit
VRAILAALVFTLLAACDQKPTFSPPPPPKVTVSPPLVQPVQDAALFTGQTFAAETVDLVARVPGFLQEIKFTDGADVKKGQTLFVIEQGQYQAQVDLNQAAIEGHQATIKSNQADFDRQASLQKQDFSTQQNYDKALAALDLEKSAAAQSQANLKIAQLNLSYTTIVAPFDGRIGRRLADVGSLVGEGGATKLATISGIDQIYVYFTVNERDFLRFRKALAESGMTREAVKSIVVFAGLTDETGMPHRGHLDFADTGVDPATGTLQLRAVFDNPKRALVPGLYVNLRIPFGGEKPAMLVPEVAVSLDQVGPYVMVVNGAGQVELRRVTLGPLQNGLRVIASGLSAADKVVVDGLQSATPGRTVTVVDGVITAAAAPAKL